MTRKSDFSPGQGAAGAADMSRRDIFALASAAATASVVPVLADTATAQTALPPANIPLTITINGRVHELSIDPRQSLLDVLREELNLTGAKKGCNQGACGACTVLVNGRRVVSCLTMAATQIGAEVLTIEGLATGDKLHPLQEAFIEHEALQCGFCTSGQIMSGVACIKEGHANSPGEIKYWMSGNICRCGAYPGIVSAVADVAKRS